MPGWTSLCGATPRDIPGSGPGSPTTVNVLSDYLPDGDLVGGVEVFDPAPLGSPMIGVITPGVVVFDGVEDDDGHPLAVFGGEGLEVHESRHRPCPALDVVGQGVVALGGGVGTQ